MGPYWHLPAHSFPQLPFHCNLPVDYSHLVTDVHSSQPTPTNLLVCFPVQTLPPQPHPVSAHIHRLHCPTATKASTWTPQCCCPIAPATLLPCCWHTCSHRPSHTTTQLLLAHMFKCGPKCHCPQWNVFADTPQSEFIVSRPGTPQTFQCGWCLTLRSREQAWSQHPRVRAWSPGVVSWAWVPRNHSEVKPVHWTQLIPQSKPQGPQRI